MSREQLVDLLAAQRELRGPTAVLCVNTNLWRGHVEAHGHVFRTSSRHGRHRLLEAHDVDLVNIHGTQGHRLERERVPQLEDFRLESRALRSKVLDGDCLALVPERTNSLDLEAEITEKLTTNPVSENGTRLTFSSDSRS